MCKKKLFSDRRPRFFALMVVFRWRKKSVLFHSFSKRAPDIRRNRCTFFSLHKLSELEFCRQILFPFFILPKVSFWSVVRQREAGMCTTGTRINIFFFFSSVSRFLRLLLFFLCGVTDSDLL